MKQQQPESDRSQDQYKLTPTKPCLCQVPALGRVFWVATDNVNAQNQSEFRCRLCSAPHWR
jgi:hypothetical protein